MLDGRPACLSDRFMLGGPTCVRMFRLNTLGPKQQRTSAPCCNHQLTFADDSLGGDAYWAAGLSVMAPIPWRPEWPLKLHSFLNAGQLTQLSPSTLQAWPTASDTNSQAAQPAVVQRAHPAVCLHRVWPLIPAGPCAARTQLWPAAIRAARRWRAQGDPVWRGTLVPVAMTSIARSLSLTAPTSMQCGTAARAT